MRRTLMKLTLLSSLATPLVGAASAPREEAAEANDHRERIECTCKRPAPHHEGPTEQKAKSDAEPSEFLKQVWTSP